MRLPVITFRAEGFLLHEAQVQGGKLARDGQHGGGFSHVRTASQVRSVECCSWITKVAVQCGAVACLYVHVCIWPP